MPYSWEDIVIFARQRGIPEEEIRSKILTAPSKEEALKSISNYKPSYGIGDYVGGAIRGIGKGLVGGALATARAPFSLASAIPVVEEVAKPVADWLAEKEAKYAVSEHAPITEKVGHILGDIASIVPLFFISGPVSTLRGAARLGGLLGAREAGTVYQYQEPEKKDIGKALAVGAASGALQMLPISGVASRFVTQAVKPQRLLTRVAIPAGVEAVTFPAMGYPIHEMYKWAGVPVGDFAETIPEQALAGMVVGGLHGVTGHRLLGKRDTGPAKEIEEPPPMTQDFPGVEHAELLTIKKLKKVREFLDHELSVSKEPVLKSQWAEDVFKMLDDPKVSSLEKLQGILNIGSRFDKGGVFIDSESKRPSEIYTEEGKIQFPFASFSLAKEKFDEATQRNLLREFFSRLEAGDPSEAEPKVIGLEDKLNYIRAKEKLLDSTISALKGLVSEVNAKKDPAQEELFKTTIQNLNKHIASFEELKVKHFGKYSDYDPELYINKIIELEKDLHDPKKMGAVHLLAGEEGGDWDRHHKDVDFDVVEPGTKLGANVKKYPEHVQVRLGWSGAFGSRLPNLYYKGGEDLLHARGIAIVGARNVKESRIPVVSQLAEFLALKHPIVSGFADGVDKAAHLGALKSGKTIAILPLGLEKLKLPADWPVDAEDRALFISPYAPDEPFTPKNAMKRNDLVVAYSKAMIIGDVGPEQVKVGDKFVYSGTWNAAQKAAKAGLPVFILYEGKPTADEVRLAKRLGDKNVFLVDVNEAGWMEKILNTIEHVTAVEERKPIVREVTREDVEAGLSRSAQLIEDVSKEQGIRKDEKEFFEKYLAEKKQEYEITGHTLSMILGEQPGIYNEVKQWMRDTIDSGVSNRLNALGGAEKALETLTSLIRTRMGGEASFEGQFQGEYAINNVKPFFGDKLGAFLNAYIRRYLIEGQEFNLDKKHPNHTMDLVFYHLDRILSDKEKELLTEIYKDNAKFAILYQSGDAEFQDRFVDVISRIAIKAMRIDDIMDVFGFYRKEAEGQPSMWEIREKISENLISELNNKKEVVSSIVDTAHDLLRRLSDAKTRPEVNVLELKQVLLDEVHTRLKELYRITEESADKALIIDELSLDVFGKAHLYAYQTYLENLLTSIQRSFSLQGIEHRIRSATQAGIESIFEGMKAELTSLSEKAGVEVSLPAEVTKETITKYVASLGRSEKDTYAVKANLFNKLEKAVFDDFGNATIKLVGKNLQNLKAEQEQTSYAQPILLRIIQHGLFNFMESGIDKLDLSEVEKTKFFNKFAEKKAEIKNNQKALVDVYLKAGENLIEYAKKKLLNDLGVKQSQRIFEEEAGQVREANVNAEFMNLYREKVSTYGEQVLADFNRFFTDYVGKILDKLDMGGILPNYEATMEAGGKRFHVIRVPLLDLTIKDISENIRQLALVEWAKTRKIDYATELRLPGVKIDEATGQMKFPLHGNRYKYVILTDEGWRKLLQGEQIDKMTDIVTDPKQINPKATSLGRAVITGIFRYVLGKDSPLTLKLQPEAEASESLKAFIKSYEDVLKYFDRPPGLHYVKGDILKSDAQAIVIPVNTEGAMGAGLARQVKEKYPDVERAYKNALKSGELDIGKVAVYKADDGKIFIFFPTKGDWRKPSQPEYIEKGLESLRNILETEGIESVAIPPLGAGLGGLKWSDVKSMIETSLQDLSDNARIEVYEPFKHIYTIGYGSDTIQAFINRLKKYGIDAVIDTRSFAEKGRSEFTLTNISKALKDAGIEYIHMGKELGGKDEKGQMYDYTERRKSPEYQAGIERVKKLIEEGKNVALMCAEGDFATCHRHLLIGEDLLKMGYAVRHISTRAQQDLTTKTFSEFLPTKKAELPVELHPHIDEFLKDPAGYAFLLSIDRALDGAEKQIIVSKGKVEIRRPMEDVAEGFASEKERVEADLYPEDAEGLEEGVDVQFRVIESAFKEKPENFADFEKRAVFMRNVLARVLGDQVKLVFGREGESAIDTLRRVFGVKFIGFSLKMHNEKFLGVVFGHGSKEDITTFGHELFHFVEPLLNEADRKLLRAKFGNNVEAIADAFGRYVYREYEPPAFLRRVFDLMGSIIEKIRNVFSGYGWKSVDDVFTAIMRGKYAKDEISASDIPLHMMSDVMVGITGPKRADLEAQFRIQVDAAYEHMKKIFTDFVGRDDSFISTYFPSERRGLLGKLGKHVYNTFIPPIYHRFLKPFYELYERSVQEVAHRLTSVRYNVIAELENIKKGGLFDVANNLIFHLDELQKYPRDREELRQILNSLGHRNLTDEQVSRLHNFISLIKDSFDREIIFTHTRAMESILDFLPRHFAERLAGNDPVLSIRPQSGNFESIYSYITGSVLPRLHILARQKLLIDGISQDVLRARAEFLQDFASIRDEVARELGFGSFDALRNSVDSGNAPVAMRLLIRAFDNIESIAQQINRLGESFYIPHLRNGGEFEFRVFRRVVDENGRVNFHEIFYGDSDRDKSSMKQMREIEDMYKRFKERLQGARIVEASTHDLYTFNGGLKEFLQQRGRDTDYVVILGRKAPKSENVLEKLSPIEAYDFLRDLLTRMELSRSSLDTERVSELLELALDKLYASNDAYMIARLLHRHRFSDDVARILGQVYIEGYNRNLEEVLTTHYAKSLGHFVNKVFDSRLLAFTSANKDSFAEVYRTNPEYRDLLIKYIDLLKAPYTGLSRVVYKVRLWTAFYYLGFRVSSALLNTVSFVTHFLPEYAVFKKIITSDAIAEDRFQALRNRYTDYEDLQLRKEGVPLKFKDVWHAYGGILGELNRGVNEIKEFVRKKWTSYDFSIIDLEKAEREGATPEQLEKLRILEYLRDSGVIESGFYNALREEGMNLFGKYSRRFFDTGLWFFRMTELYTRAASAMIMAEKFRHLQDVGLECERAAIIRSVLAKVYGDYTRANRLWWTNPATAFGAIASLPTTLKGFVLNTIGLFADSVERREWARLGLMLTGFALLGGVRSIPLLDDLAEIGEKIAEKFGYRKPVRMVVKNELSRIVGDDITEMLIGGAPRMLKLMDLSQSMKVELPFIPKELSWAGIGEALFGVYKGEFERLGRAKDLMAVNDYLGALVYLLPLGLSMPIQGYLLSERGLQTKAGKAIIDVEAGQGFSLSPTEAIVRAMGFRPVSLADVQDKRFFANKVVSSYEAWSRKIYQKYRNALRENKDLQEIFDEIMEFNQDVLEFSGAIPPITRRSLKRALAPKKEKYERIVEALRI